MVGKANKKEEELILSIYRRIYAEIGEDFDEIDKSYANWFLDYYLPHETQNEIIDNLLKGKKLTKLKKQMIKNTVYLGVLPRG